MPCSSSTWLSVADSWLVVLAFFLRLRFDKAGSSSLLGLPMPKLAALSLSVRVTVATRCLRFWAVSEGLGANSLISSPTVRVCSGDVLAAREELRSSATAAYSLPSSPTEGMSTEPERPMASGTPRLPLFWERNGWGLLGRKGISFQGGTAQNGRG